MIRSVAGHAGHRPRRRPALVPEELLAERDLLRSDGVVVRDLRGVLLKPHRQFELEVRRRRPAGEQEEDGGNEKSDACSHRINAGSIERARDASAGRQYADIPQERCAVPVPPFVDDLAVLQFVDGTAMHAPRSVGRRDPHELAAVRSFGVPARDDE